MINMRQPTAVIVLVILSALASGPALGHCDTLDGPVVLDAKALNKRSADQLAAALGERVAVGLRERFATVVAAKHHADKSVEAGRAYVAAYVEYVHYVEAAHALASRPASQHRHIHAAAR